MLFLKILGLSKFSRFFQISVLHCGWLWSSVVVLCVKLLKWIFGLVLSQVLFYGHLWHALRVSLLYLATHGGHLLKLLSFKFLHDVSYKPSCIILILQSLSVILEAEMVIWFCWQVNSKSSDVCACIQDLGIHPLLALGQSATNECLPVSHCWTLQLYFTACGKWNREKCFLCSMLSMSSQAYSWCVECIVD